MSGSTDLGNFATRMYFGESTKASNGLAGYVFSPVGSPEFPRFGRIVVGTGQFTRIIPQRLGK